jgi:hypothetical protein
MLTSGAGQRAKAPGPRRRRGPPPPARRPGRRPQPHRRLLHRPLHPLQHQQLGLRRCQMVSSALGLVRRAHSEPPMQVVYSDAYIRQPWA